LGAIDLAAIVAGRTILGQANQAELHRIADLRSMNLRDRIVGDLHAAIGVADGAAGVGIAEPIADVSDGGLAASANLGGERISVALIGRRRRKQRHEGHANKPWSHQDPPAMLNRHPFSRAA
jgi:hypothetical protein